MNIPTAKELHRKFMNKSNWSIEELMIEFTKLHIEAALQTASEEAIAKEDPKDYGTGKIWVDEKSILTAYPLTNIE